MLFGLTGPNASGKGEVARYLEGLGWPAYSLSDVVREEARAQGLDVGRESLIRTGNRLREADGPGVLAERILERLGPRAVVDSIRHPAEVAVLRRRPDFRLVGVRASVETRFERMRLRGRAGDAPDLSTFREHEERESGRQPAGQDLPGTMALADRTVDNEGSLEDLHRGVGDLLRAFAGEGLEV